LRGLNRGLGSGGLGRLLVVVVMVMVVMVVVTMEFRCFVAFAGLVGEN
jgi:hypothetical protein